jgi:hypothetical protein
MNDSILKHHNTNCAEIQKVVAAACIEHAREETRDAKRHVHTEEAVA